ncbi:hypothetical protein Nepgr_003730 [Nepenthes gracilis]|uniref:Uncharacterized protein n=1 Tax=Nepenthes gracilis TaxID=150966 RepID=A0AAD3XEC7_NEPGR|nr:hypothetical protein Nepgr_003730 [Nepenthes gracilis]
MVNTRVQESEPVRDVASLDQDHAIGVMVNGVASMVLAPFFQNLVEHMVVQADPRLEKIWNCVFKDDEHTANIDRSPFTAEILNRPMPICGEEFLKWPKPLKKAEGGNLSKYCGFYRSPGYSTENYKTLQREIEELIRRGHLTRFIKGLGVVNMITTWPIKNPANNKEQQTGGKKQCTTDTVIRFCDSDLSHVVSPHADPLVVSILVSDGNVDYQLK